MISRCVNRTCHTEFKLFNSGYLYAYERPYVDTEFFWLCSTCASQLAPCLDADGNVIVMPRTAARTAHPPRFGGNIRLVGAPKPRIPWRRCIPADEAEAGYGFGLDQVSLHFDAA